MILYVKTDDQECDEDIRTLLDALNWLRIDAKVYLIGEGWDTWERCLYLNLSGMVSVSKLPEGRQINVDNYKD